MSLPDLLRELSSALQSGGGRIRVQKDMAFGVGPMETVHVIYGGKQSRCGILTPAKFSAFDDPFTLLHLEAALREECEARGWRWWIFCPPHPSTGIYAAVVYATGEELDDHYASTPAEALALAVLGALKAEKGEG